MQVLVGIVTGKKHNHENSNQVNLKWRTNTQEVTAAGE